MERFFEFIQNHPLLFGIFLGCLILFFLLESKRSGKKISPQQLGLIVQNQNAKVIDLRDNKEFAAGHISGSEHIPFSKIKDELARLKAINEPLIFVCKMGTHAGSAVQQLEKDNVYRLEGGILNWQGQGLPLVTDKKSRKTPQKKKK